MPLALSAFFMALAAPLVRSVLISLGIGFISFVGFDAVVSSLLSSAKSNFSGLTVSVSSILAMAGFFKAMGIISGGIITGLSMMILKRIGRV